MFLPLFFLVTFFLFILGTIVGSFINVVIHRSIEGEQWIKGRSKCDHCGKVLPWYDMFPLLSYFVLQGKSRCCHKPLSISHPVVEFLTGILFVWWYWSGTFFFQLAQAPFTVIQPLFWLLVGVLLVIIFFTDLWYQIIPDFAVFLLAGLTFLYRLALVFTGIMRFEDFMLTVLVAVVMVGFFWALWFFTKGNGMGFGDVKLVVPLTFLLGGPNSVVGIFLGFCLGAVVGLLLILLGKKKFGQHIPFGPFLITGTLIALVLGDRIIQWYLGML